VKQKEKDMTIAWIRRFRSLEGRHVCVALQDGARLDDCELVSMARHPVTSLWLFTNGSDVFVPLDAVVEVWETTTPPAAA
jgi:hypothetical protein